MILWRHRTNFCLTKKLHPKCASCFSNSCKTPFIFNVWFLKYGLFVKVIIYLYYRYAQEKIHTIGTLTKVFLECQKHFYWCLFIQNRFSLRWLILLKVVLKNEYDQDHQTYHHGNRYVSDRKLPMVIYAFKFHFFFIIIWH